MPHQDAPGVSPTQDTDVVQALPPHGSEEPFAGPILCGARYAVRTCSTLLAPATRRLAAHPWHALALLDCPRK
jgi:hypothetical protein